jgi:UDPglucose 6-dehydrogenase
MIDALLKEGASITAYDPEAMNNVQALLGDAIAFATNEYEALEGADALLICTEWGVFRNPDFDRMAELLKDKVIFDGRNLFEVTEMNAKGFYYSSIGRTTVSQSVQV